MSSEEFRQDGEIVYQGQLLEVHRDRVRLPDGQSAVREYIRHPGAAVILAFLSGEDGERLAMVRQFRYPLLQSFLELPAGKLEKGEDPLLCAKRELMEECGFEAKTWQSLGLFYPCIGYSNEVIHIFSARDLKAVVRPHVEGEFLEEHFLSEQELWQEVVAGRVTDGKTLAVLARWESLRMVKN